MNKLLTKTKQIFYYLLFLALTLMSATKTYAPIKNPAVPKWGDPDQPGLAEGVPFITYSILMWQAATTIGALIVIAYYVMGAYEWLSSGEKTEGVEKAKKRITNATIGLVVLVSSFTIIGWIGKILFGDTFDIFNLTLPGT